MLSMPSHACDVVKKWIPETHSKRQASQHDMPSLLDEGDTGIVMVYDEKNILYWGD